jgi:subtilisin family serine protease
MHSPTGRLGRLLAGAAAIAATGLIVPSAATAAPTGTTGPAENYLVLFKGSSSPADAAAIVTRAGGTVVKNYSQIGVLVARSNNTAFDDTMRANNKVEGASATARYATQVDGAAVDTAEAQPGDLPNAQATDSDSLSGLQWDMRQMHTPEAHKITGGSPAVVAATIDTGVDYRHPDLRQNISDADSANCTSGAPVPGAAAADDDNGHGTHTAGTIAAAANGVGIVGVAPNVKIAGIKAGNADGFFFPEAVVGAFVWAGDRHVDVTNNSYFVDPFLFNCRNDAEQRAIWKAVQRAVRYAMNQGVTVVSAEGNESEDLSHPTVDATSPDDTTPVTREVTNACVVLPVELPGVIGVTATGSMTQDTSEGDHADNLKSYYSSFGMSSADVAAPGGDFYFRGTDPGAQAVQGQILSTWPADQPCTRSRQEPTGDPTYPTAVYCAIQGTSMANPHVAGLAALVISRYGDGKTPQNGTMRPTQVEQIISQTADPQACPTTLPDANAGSLGAAGVNYGQIAGSQSGAPQQCQGNGGHTSWYGQGQVDALAAITNDRSNN